MNGTSSFTSAGVTIETSSIPHAFADDMRRCSSCIRSSVRATSMPPLSVKTPGSRYWRTESSVSCVISFEWSTGKMKFDAWPVEPPGFGSGPLSSRTRSVQPSSARWPARLLPTMPAPITTARAVVGQEERSQSWRLIYHDRAARHASASSKCLDVPAHQLRRRARRLPRRIASSSPACSSTAPPSSVAGEREHPDPLGVRVVRLERLRQELVVARAVDRPVDALVERRSAHGRRGRRPDRAPRAGRSSSSRSACVARSAASLRRLGLEHRAHLAEPREVAHVDGGHEDARAAGTPRRAAPARAGAAPPAPASGRSRARSVSSGSRTAEPGGSSSETISSRIA